MQTLQINLPKWTKYDGFYIHEEKNSIHISPERREWIEKSKPEFNSYQYFLYRRCLFGIEVYSNEEREYMKKEKKERIIKVHKHALEILNIFKQQQLIRITNSLVLRFCRHDSFVMDLVNTKEVDPEFNCNIEFKDLGISRKMIAGELVSKRILPYNYFQMTVNDDPRMKKIKNHTGVIDNF